LPGVLVHAEGNLGPDRTDDFLRDWAIWRERGTQEDISGFSSEQEGSDYPGFVERVMPIV
jgi:hypothetical protein